MKSHLKEDEGVRLDARVVQEELVGADEDVAVAERKPEPDQPECQDTLKC